MTRRTAKHLIALSVLTAVLLATVRLWLAAVVWVGFGLWGGAGNHDDYLFSGVVVDSDGHEVHEVFLGVSESRKIKAGFESGTSSRVQRIGPAFELAVNDADSVYLHFTKAGYEVETLGFGQGGEYRNLRIVMRPKPAAATQRTLGASEAGRINRIGG